MRRQTRLVRNPCAFERDGRLNLTDRDRAGRPADPDVSIRVRPAVRRVLDPAPVPVPGTTSRGRSRSNPRAFSSSGSPGWSGSCARGTCVVRLRPPVTADPFATMSGQLAGTETGAALTAAAGRLDRVTRGLERGSGPRRGRSGLADLRQYLGAVHPVGGDEVVQVDSALPLADATLSAQVGVDAARAVDLLLRMHPSPGWSSPTRRIPRGIPGPLRTGPLVPVLELLDPRFGLGPPGPAHARGAPQLAEQRSQRLSSWPTRRCVTGQTKWSWPTTTCSA